MRNPRRIVLVLFGVITWAASSAGWSRSLALAQVTGAKTIQSAVVPFPNVPLRTHENKPVRFYDDLIKGKVVLINFIFTSCTSICPRTTANLVKVEEAFAERFGRDVFIVSVTVDPATDTPEVLKKYAASHHTQPGWLFVTGKQEDIDLIRRKLGVYGDDGDKTQHTGILVYGNEPGNVWAATPALSAPGAIVKSVLKVMDPEKRSTKPNALSR